MQTLLPAHHIHIVAAGRQNSSVKPAPRRFEHTTQCAWPGRGSRAPSPRARRHLTPAQRDAFFEDGLVVLGKLLDEAAVAAIEVEYDRFMSGIHAGGDGERLHRHVQALRHALR